MKKIFIFILLFIATHAHAGTAVIGTHHKQIGNTLLFANDIKVLSFEGISTIGLATGGGGISDATFSGYTAGADLQNAYNKGSTINTNPTNGAVEFRYGGNDGEIFILSKTGGTPVFRCFTSGCPLAKIHLADIRSSGTSGGTPAAGAWNIIRFNTKIVDNMGFANISAPNVIQLSIGPALKTFDFCATSSTLSSEGTVLQLFDITNNEIVQEPGINLKLPAGTSGANATGCGHVTFSGERSYRVEQYFQNSAANGLGATSTSGGNEHYSDIVFNERLGRLIP